jgi:hypothetical protein
MTYDLQAADAGCIVTLTVYDSVTLAAKNISSATVKKFYIKNKMSTSAASSVDATFTTDGTDGKLYYTTTATTFPTAGYYCIQAYVEIGTVILKSSSVDINVGPNC